MVYITMGEFILKSEIVLEKMLFKIYQLKENFPKVELTQDYR